MKKTKIMVLALIGLMTRSMVCKANENMVFAENLPTDAKAFFQNKFPRLSIAFAETRGTRQGIVYEVSLNDDTEVIFSQKGAWGMINCKLESVPASPIPASLSSFAASQFDGAKVVRLAKTDNGYVAVLSNGVLLKTDLQGKLA